MKRDPQAVPVAGTRPDRRLLSLGMILVALLVGVAIQIKDGTYQPAAMILIGLSLLVGIAFLGINSVNDKDIPPFWILLPLVLGILVELIIAMVDWRASDSSMAASSAIVCMAFACLLPVPKLQLALVWLMLVAFLWMGAMHIAEHPHTGVDVLVFQGDGAKELLVGRNPYAMRFPNVYGNNKSFYGPGVVDENNMLTIGFPYPPASLLMITPSVALTNDVRYSDLAALVISAGLMAFAMPGRLSALTAALFMLSPRNMLVLEYSWTESLLLMTFSLMLFLAIRKKSIMPYALGLFFATKQSSVLALPGSGAAGAGSRILPEADRNASQGGCGRNCDHTAVLSLESARILARRRAMAVYPTLPPDALSFMVWLKQNELMPWLFTGPEHRPTMLVPFALVVGVALLAVWRSPRTPAGFAATVCMLNLVFFAFSKQAFCNYYFFAIGAACWALALSKPQIENREKSFLARSLATGV